MGNARDGKIEGRAAEAAERIDRFLKGDRTGARPD